MQYIHPLFMLCLLAAVIHIHRLGKQALAVNPKSPEAGQYDLFMHQHQKLSTLITALIFAGLLGGIFSRLNQRFAELPQRTDKPFEKIERLIGIMMDFVTEYPNETKLVLATCPARLKENAEACRRHYVDFRGKLEDYIGKCLRSGIRSKDFRKVPVPQTVNIIIALVNGLLRQRAAGLITEKDLRAAAISFCRAALSA